MKVLLENWKGYLKESKLRLTHNDFSFGRVDIEKASKEYSDLGLDNYLAISDLETYESGRGYFGRLLNMVEEYAKENGYAGIVLRAETQDMSRASQENLEEMYKKFGYRYLSTDPDDTDVFMIKKFL